jgi:drug/metabolite transporter (DMT)-like permease
LRPLSRGAAVLLMIVAPVLWSTAGVVTRHIEQAQAFEQVFWRSFFAAAFVGCALVFLQLSPLRAGRPGLLSGAMWALMFTAFVIALSLTTTANALVMMSVSPFLTALLGKLFLKDPIPVRTWIAATAAAVGMTWMFAGGLEMSARDVTGMAVALLIPAASAVNVVALRAAHASLDLRPAVMLGAVLSCLIALPFALPFTATARDVALLAFLGVFQLGLPCMLLVMASRSLLGPEIALLGLLEVVLGPLWAWLGAGEVPAMATLIGGAVVLAALAGNEAAALRRTAIRV